MSGRTSQGGHQRGGQPPEWNNALGPWCHQHLIKTPMLLLWLEELELLTSPTAMGGAHQSSLSGFYGVHVWCICKDSVRNTVSLYLMTAFA